jgi:hypothetical protein
MTKYQIGATTFNLEAPQLPDTIPDLLIAITIGLALATIHTHLWYTLWAYLLVNTDLTKI